MAPNLKKHLDDVSISADWIGLRYVSEDTTNRSVRDLKPEESYRSHSSGIMVEVMVNGQIGYCATQDVTNTGINRAARMARMQADKMKAFGLKSFDPTFVRPKARINFSSPQLLPFDDLSVKEQFNFLTECCKTLKASPKIVSTQAAFSFTTHTTHLVSTSGTNAEQTVHLVSSEQAAVAQDGNEIQRRTDHGGRGLCFQGGAELLNIDEFKVRAKKISSEAVELLSAENCPTETTTLVLHPDQMLLQIHESIGHPIELDRLLGDERNYAGSSFVKLEDFGNLQYGSKHLNVTFDPTQVGEFASSAFDDSGLEAKKEFLIKEGLLVRPLGGTESAARSSLEPVANFRSSSWNRASIDRMANINVEPGDLSVEELIGDVENGVYMESNLSWSIDDYRRKFQFGCEYAKKIENGKLTKTLKHPNYRGESLQFWRSLDGVANQDSWSFFGSPYCGKGEPNQVIRVGHGSSMCRFKDIEVFGG